LGEKKWEKVRGNGNGEKQRQTSPLPEQLRSEKFFGEVKEGQIKIKMTRTWNTQGKD